MNAFNMSLLALILGVALATCHSQEPPATSRPQLLVVNQKLNAVQFVDVDSGKVTATVKTKDIRGHEAVVSKDGRLAYIPIYGNSGVGKPGTDGRTIEVLDTTAKKFVDTIDLGRPARPHCIRLGPDGLFYVTAEVGQTVEVIDPASGKHVASIPTNQDYSHMLAISRDGKRAYTSNVGVGSVTAIDLLKRTVISVIPVAKVTQRISLSVDDKYVFTADQDAPRLAVIETATNKIKEWITLPSIGYGTASTPDGRWLLVALITGSKLAVVDLASMKVSRTIDVAGGPMEILVQPDRNVAYVSCFAGGKVAIVDLKTWQVNKLIETGEGADGLAWIP
jgi:DNA-binding beta-propeller fold protein YncE